jgi:putative ABC transport system permease protein
VLAFAELGRDPRRLGVMAVAIVSPITTGFATDGFISSAESSIRQSFDEGGDGVSIATADAGTGSVDAFISPEVRAALAALPDVASLESGTFVSVGHDAGDLLGVETFTDIDLDDWDYLRGSPDEAAFAAGEVLIGPGLARREGARPGDTLTVPTPTGLRDLLVQGIVDSGDASGFIVVVHPDRFRELYGDRPAAFLVLRPAAGVSESALAASVQAAVRAGIDPVLQVKTTDEVADDIVEAIGERMLPFRVMQQSLLLVAFVAVLSTLLLAGLQRRREHGLLAAVGADPGTLRRLVFGEAAVVAAAAVVVALVGAPLTLWAMLQVIPLLIGEHNPFSPDWVSFAINATVAVVVVLLAAAWPAWRAGRVEVLEALRYE